MEAEKVADSMLEECGLGSVDAARLTLEMTENLGSLAQGKPRSELLLILRRVIHAGVQAVEREEYTVSLETAAWASVEARCDRVRPVTLRDLRHYVRRILKVEGVAGLQLRTITTGMCRHILREAFGASRHSYVRPRHPAQYFCLRHTPRMVRFQPRGSYRSAAGRRKTDCTPEPG